MSKRMKICINTGGGDAPGLNAVIEAVTMAAYTRQWEVYGIKCGYTGLMNTEEIITLTPEKVNGIASVGSAAMDNEECYLYQKWLRSLGLVAIEHQARI